MDDPDTILHVDGEITLDQQTTNPSSPDANAQSRIYHFHKHGSGGSSEPYLVIQYNSFSTIRYRTLNLDHAGGSVTQSGSITNGVTLNRRSGQITTVSQTVAAGANATFTVTNSEVADTKDIVSVSVATKNGAGLFIAHVTDVQAGQFDITIQNIGGDAGDNTLLINFTLHSPGAEWVCTTTAPN